LNNATSSGNTGSTNTALGLQAGANLTTGNNNIDIGNIGVSAESNTIRIGTQGTQAATYVAGIFGATVTDGAPVLVDSNGHLGTAVSSAQFKEDIRPMDKASEAILALEPVTFHYKTD
jgi:cell division GTPase FtsZ